MKTFIIGVGAFGFAMLKHISDKNQGDIIYAYEKNDFVLNYLKNFKKHPYFFEKIKLGDNICFMDKMDDILMTTDLLILALPCQIVPTLINEIKSKLKPGITILNLAKGINNKTLNTIGDDLKPILKEISYNYACLSGGMIAQELAEGKFLGATIGIETYVLGEKLKQYLESDKLKIELFTDSVKNIELAGALKNIFAIVVGYYEGLGYGASSLGYVFCEFRLEYKKMFSLLGGNDEIKFYYFAIGGDLIATCFGNSRNRYFGKLIGEGKTSKEALDILSSEKKIAEGYETLKAISMIIKDKEGFPITNDICKKILD